MCSLPTVQTVGYVRNLIALPSPILNITTTTTTTTHTLLFTTVVYILCKL